MIEPNRSYSDAPHRHHPTLSRYRKNTLHAFKSWSFSLYSGLLAVAAFFLGRTMPVHYSIYIASPFMRSSMSHICATTKAGSSVWIKWPQPFAMTGPLVSFAAVMWMRPSLYFCQHGFIYNMVKIFGVCMVPCIESEPHPRCWRITIAYREALLRESIPVMPNNGKKWPFTGWSY